MGRPLPLTIEDSATYRRFKLVAEDIGWLTCYPESRCVQIEGICYRYLIYGPDVAQLEAASAVVTKTVLLGFRVGGQTLTLALFSQSAATALGRKSVSPGQALLDELAGTLGVGEVDADDEVGAEMIEEEGA